MIRGVIDDLENGEDEALASFRPALQRLTLDAYDLIHGNDEKDVPGLLGGFEDRQTLITWQQRLAVRTLGEVPMFWYLGVASALASSEDRPLVNALLDDRRMDPRTRKDWRTRVRKRVVLQSFDRAYRELRKDATNYGSEVTEDEHLHPHKQRYIAMRPSLDELDTWQQHALDELLNGGLEMRDAILDWSTVVSNATNGEPIFLPNDDTVTVGEFFGYCHERDPMAELLVEQEYRRVRETFAARFLLPAFNAGVRSILAKSGEIPNIERKPTEATFV